jgi:hypothetical protein
MQTYFLSLHLFVVFLQSGNFSLRFSQKVRWVGNKFAYLLPDLGFGLFGADRLGTI